MLERHEKRAHISYHYKMILQTFHLFLHQNELGIWTCTKLILPVRVIFTYCSTVRRKNCRYQNSQFFTETFKLIDSCFNIRKEVLIAIAYKNLESYGKNLGSLAFSNSL